VKTTATTALMQAVEAFVAAASQRTTTEAVLRHFTAQKGMAPGQVRAAIRRLVDTGELCYSYELGCSFLQPSFNRPKKVSGRVVLTPPMHADKTVWPEVLVRLSPGAAFGYGQHPTTRLALRAIETAIDKWPDFLLRPDSSVLDIGTGSGVLVITAVLMGVRQGTGIDIDPCSLAEAETNVNLNGLRRKIRVTDTPLDRQHGSFSMITANLRYPTLSRISTGVGRRIKKQGVLIVSGIKAGELINLVETYQRLDFKAVREWHEKGWAGILLQKQAQSFG
jgi:ribosomal protein L11 methyltransferase